MTRRGHGEGSIYQRSDGRWAAGISLEGGKRKTFYGKTRREVQEQLKTALHEQQKGLLATGPQQKVGQFLTHWLENVHKQSIRSRTYERYEEIVRLHLVPGIGHHQLQKLSPPAPSVILREETGGGAFCDNGDQLSQRAPQSA